MKLLERKGVFVSDSDLLKAIMQPCFAPHVPYQQQSGQSVIYEQMPKGELKRLLTPRFRAWVEPLIENKEAIVRLDEFSNGMWTVWIWVSHEYLFRRHVQELEMAAREEEKSRKSGKIPDKTMTPYLTGRQLRAAKRRAKRLELKRTRSSGESRMLRLVASHTLPEFLQYLEAQEAAPSQPPTPAPKGETHNA